MNTVDETETCIATNCLAMRYVERVVFAYILFFVKTCMLPYRNDYLGKVSIVYISLYNKTYLYIEYSVHFTMVMLQ